MAETRLSKLTKQFSIGLAHLVEFLNEKGANVEMNPNAKVSDEFLPAIEAKFGEDQKLKKDSEKVSIKLKEIIEIGSKKKGANDEEIPEKEVVIKSNTLKAEIAPKPVEEPVAEVKPAVEPAAPAVGPKVIDKIDLSQFEKKPAKKEEAPQVKEVIVEKPVEAPAVEVKPVVEPKKEETVKVETVEAAPVKVEEKNQPREVKVEVEKLAGPKVIDKIDLSQFDPKKKKKKRERIEKGGSQKVDVTKVEAVNGGKKDKNKGGNNGQQQNNNHGKNNNQNNNNNNNGKKNNRRDRGAEKFKPAMTEAEQEEMQKEIQKQIKETYARMNEGKKNNFGAKHRKDKREAAS